MKKDMYIKTDNGNMVIHIDEFFPCDKARFRKLFRIIKQFSHLNNVHKITEQLKEHFTEQINILDVKRKEESAGYWRWRQRYAAFDDIIYSGKFPNGVKLTKEQLKAVKANYKDAKGWAHTYEMNFKRYTRQLEAYKKNLELLGQL